MGLILMPLVLVAKGALYMIGFSSQGPVGGSIAALIQSGIGNVVAGSIFAICQWLAMTSIWAF